MRKRKNRIVALCCIMSCLLLCSCRQDDTAVNAKGVVTESSTQEGSQEQTEQIQPDEGYTEEIFAMDTYMTLTAYGSRAEEAVKAGIEEIQRLDALLSIGDENSEITAINRDGGGLMSEDTAYLTARAKEIFESTGGAFDISIYPVMELWGFTTGNFAVPAQETLEEKLALVNGGSIAAETDEASGKERISLELGMQIDLGGIAKGYTSGRVMDIFREYGVTSAVINLGGNAQVLGNKTDGSKWRVGIQDPEDEYGYIGGVEVSDKAVITSGGYERYFKDEETGKAYHHIIDPDTGYPAENGLISVTIVSGDSTLADGLSTALFVLGTEDAITYCERHCAEYSFDAILETEDGELYITDELKDSFIDINGNTPFHTIATR